MRETLSDNRIINYDFIKGVAIIFVILLHLFSAYSVLPPHVAYHIGNAVPLFLITTTLLRYKKLEKSGMNGYWSSIVESTSKCKIIIFFCRTRILVFENLVFVLAFCLFSSVSLQFFCL